MQMPVSNVEIIISTENNLQINCLHFFLKVFGDYKAALDGLLKMLEKVSSI